MSAARESGGYLSTVQLLISELLADMALVFNIAPALRRLFSAPRDHHVTLHILDDLAAGASVYTGYFEATRPCEVGLVKSNAGTIPGTFSALTADVLVTHVTTEASGLHGGTPVSILTRATMTLDHDTALADEDQKWYLAQGDKVRVQVAAVGSSSMSAGSIQFQVVIREY